jgi:hypothetical protein
VLSHLATTVDANTLASPGLLTALVNVPDPRKPRGVRHQVTAILALAVWAVLAGARSFTAIGEWAAVHVVTEQPTGLSCGDGLDHTQRRVGGDQSAAA